MASARIFGLEVVGGSAGEELVRCPFHEDNSPSAWFNPKKELFWCSVCNMGLSGLQVANKLCFEMDMSLEYEPPDYSFVLGEEVIEWGMATYHPYLQNRGVSEESFGYYGVMYKQDSPEAIALPITTVDHMRVGVAYRYLNPAQTHTRYRFMGEMQPIWPMHRLAQSVKGKLKVIVEGAFSAMKMHSFALELGYSVQSFALLGAKANQKIVDTVRFMGDEVVFLYDNDVAGQRAKEKLQRLWPSVRAFCVGPSPDDMNRQQYVKLIHKVL